MKKKEADKIDEELNIYDNKEVWIAGDKVSYKVYLCFGILIIICILMIYFAFFR